MTFFKNNAYPDVILHDCNFQIKEIDNNIQFIFPEGVGVVRDNKLVWDIKAMLQLSNCSMDDISIYSVLHSNFLGIHRAIFKEISIKELNRLFENGGYLQLYNEYYSFEQFVWECSIYPYKFNKKFAKKYGEIVIRAITEAPLEYYLKE